MVSSSPTKPGCWPESPWSSRSLPPFLAVLVLLASRTNGFQCSPLPPIHHHHNKNIMVDTHTIHNNNNNEPSTRLSARAPGNRRKSNTAAYYSSNTADPPLSSDKVKTFGKRMRDLVTREQRTKKLQQSQSTSTKRSRINPAKPSFVQEAVTLQRYKELVADEHERLVVVRFYAKWCKACKAVEPLFYRMAHSMQNSNVLFVEVPVLEQNANLHQGLGVPALPYAHIYSPTAGLVEELRMCKKQFQNFQNVVETYKEGQCSDLEMDHETGLFLSPFLEKETQVSN